MQQTTIRKRHSGRRSKRRPYDNCAIDACMSKEDALQLWDELHYWSGYLKRRDHCDAHLLYMRFEREILDLHSDDDAKAFMLEHKGTDYATEVEHATGAATFRYAIEKLYDEGLCMRKCEVLYLILLMNRADNLKATCDQTSHESMHCLVCSSKCRSRRTLAKNLITTH